MTLHSPPKRCAKCGESKPITAFWLDKRKADGRRLDCADCCSARRRHLAAEPIEIGPEYLVEDRGYETPCWIWQRGCDRKGYGVSALNGRWIYAHKRFYIEHGGTVPDDLCLDHLCRIHPCVNPEHLELVTVGENVRRGLRAKITWDDVAEIRSTAESAAVLAQRYGLHPNTIYKIRSGLSWATP